MLFTAEAQRFKQKNARPLAGQQKAEPDWGCRFLWPAKRERAGLRRATAYSQKSTSSYHQKTFIKQVAASLIMIKDYPEDKSKQSRQKDGKAG
jgi:hypothetical protein